MKVAETAAKINRLTPDSDERQELWVRCLENGDADVQALSEHLLSIRKNFSEEELLQITLWRRVNSLEQMGLLDLFDHFTDLEQSIMQLLALGSSLEEIGIIKGIKEVRLRHIISVIREHKVWTKHGTEAPLNR